ncbi:hypothetical protein C8J56DRAFT_974919 [Mycena floridula]|nr:hypothetical protein C8J56DRAFT_974919 [Mycena floridula]
MFSTLFLSQLFLLCVCGKLLTMTVPDTVEIGQRSVVSWTADSSDDDQQYSISSQNSDTPLLPGIFITTLTLGREDGNEGTFKLPPTALSPGTYVLTAQPLGDNSGPLTRNNSDTITSNPFQVVFPGGGGGLGDPGEAQSSSSITSPTGTDDGPSAKKPKG